MALKDFPTILNEFPATLMQLLIPSVHPIDEAACAIVHPGADLLNLLVKASWELCHTPLPLNFIAVGLYKCHPIEARFCSVAPCVCDVHGI